MSKTIQMADLFCGAGGTSEGGRQAIEERGMQCALLAVNHDDTAILTHMSNHPAAKHLLTGLDRINPRELYREGELDILWASPECTHHSSARGGRPIQEQSRATAHCVTRWADALLPRVVWVENVPEFLTWGPIDAKGRPIKHRRGEMFAAWKSMLEATGYRVEWRVVCCADYGDPTTRKRLFVRATRGSRRYKWPEPSHAELRGDEGAQAELFLARRKPWKTAADHVIDWDLKGQLLTERKKPLADKTMRRIIVGFFRQLEKKGFGPFVVPNFGEHRTQAARSHDVDQPLPSVTSHGAGCLVEPVPLIIPQNGHRPARPTTEPLPAVTTTSRGIGFAEPILVRFQGDHAGKDDGARRVQDVDQPIGAVTTENRYGLSEPLLVELRGTNAQQVDASGKSVLAPLGTITSGGIHHALVVPLVVSIDHQSGQQVRGADQPISAMTTKARHAIAEPMLVQVNHGNGRCGDNGDGRRVKDVQEPLPTVCGDRGEWSLVEPMILPQHSAGVMRGVSEPVPTVAGAGAIALVQAYLVKFYGTGVDADIDAPLDTVTAKERFGLVLPVLEFSDGTKIMVNFRFRMLQPHELAAAQGFPRSYIFKGTKTQQVKQIGNAVPCHTAKALIASVL